MIKQNSSHGASQWSSPVPAKIKALRLASVVLLSSLLLACGGSDSVTADDTGGSTSGDTGGGTGGDTAGGTGGDTGGDDGGSGTVSFQSIQQSVFTPNCVSCHGGANPISGLDLSSGNAYASLVGVGSSGKDGAVLVINSDPDNSYLVQKLEGAAGIVGQRMPPGQDALPAATIQTVRDWIAGGALDN